MSDYDDCRSAGGTHEYCAARYGATDADRTSYDEANADPYGDQPGGGRTPGGLGTGDRTVDYTGKPKPGPKQRKAAEDALNAADDYWYNPETGLYEREDEGGFFDDVSETVGLSDEGPRGDPSQEGTWTTELQEGETFWDPRSHQLTDDEIEDYEEKWDNLSLTEKSRYGTFSAFLNQMQEKVLRERAGLGSDFALEEARKLARMAKGEHEASAWETDLRKALADEADKLYGGLEFAGDNRAKQARSLALALNQQDSTIMSHIAKGRQREAELASEDLEAYLENARNMGMEGYQAKEMQLLQYQAEQNKSTMDVIGSVLGAVATAVGIYLAATGGISDERLKESVKKFDIVKSKVPGLVLKTWVWNELGIEALGIKGEDVGKRQLGYIAQEVLPHYPEAVSVNKDGWLQINYALLEGLEEN